MTPPVIHHNLRTFNVIIKSSNPNETVAQIVTNNYIYIFKFLSIELD